MSANDTAVSRTPPAAYRDSSALERERYKLAIRIERALRRPMIVLGFVWLVLLVIDLTRGLPPSLSRVSYTIWALFIAQFVLEFGDAPQDHLPPAQLSHHARPARAGRSVARRAARRARARGSARCAARARPWGRHAPPAHTPRAH